MIFRCFRFVGIEWHTLWHRARLVCGAAAAAAVRTRGRTSGPTGNMPWQDFWLVRGLYWLMASISTRLGGDKIYEGVVDILVLCKGYCIKRLHDGSKNKTTLKHGFECVKV